MKYKVLMKYKDIRIIYSEYKKFKIYFSQLNWKRYLKYRILNEKNKIAEMISTNCPVRYIRFPKSVSCFSAISFTWLHLGWKIEIGLCRL